MERYNTAEIELVGLEEDIITSSGTNSTTTPTPESCTFSHDGNVWIVTFSDGSITNYHYEHDPDDHNRPFDICP